MFSDIYKIKVSENGMMIEVEGKVNRTPRVRGLSLQFRNPVMRSESVI